MRRAAHGTRTRDLRFLAKAVALSAAAALPAACQSSQSSSRGGADRPGNAAALEPPTPSNLDEQYLIGPTACRELGYRIDWQARTYPQDTSGIRKLEIQEDSVFVLDGQNFLTRLRRDDGRRLWRLPVADPHNQIHGITYLADLEQIFLTTGGAMLVLDSDTGSQVAKHRLQQIANTAPVVSGPFLVYGARNGQLVWHSYQVGYQWRAYQISPSIRIEPLLIDDSVVTIGADGRIMALDSDTASGLWDKRLLDAVVASPDGGAGMVYVAGLDQYVWAFELGTGRRAWRYLTEAPLLNPPVLVGDSLYQQVPNEGLIRFEARPIDAPGGKVIWTARNVAGNLVGEHDNRLLVWDSERRGMTVLDSGLGATISTVSLGGVQHLRTTARRDGDVFAAGEDGRVIRLVPR